MQFPGQGKPPVGVVFDSDMGNSIDDVLALALLYGLQTRGECRLVGLSVSKSNLKAAALCEVLARFYGGRLLPVGLSTAGRMPEDTALLDGTLARRDSSGKPVYEHTIRRLVDTADPAASIRNAFTAQHDGNCVVVVVGPATNFVRLLALPGVKDLAARKVRLLCMMGGNFAGGEPEWNIRQDVAAAQLLFREWPTAMVASGFEVGQTLLYPAASIEKDFLWTENHPVVDAYRAHGTMPYDAPTWDVTAALYAVRPGEGYFRLSEPGSIEIADDGTTRFTASARGRHRYLILDPAQRERIVKTYVELVSTQPPLRPSRRS